MSNEVLALGHRSIIRGWHRDAQKLCRALVDSEQEIPKEVASSSDMSMLKALWAMAQGDAAEASLLLGPQQERQDAELRKLIEDAKLGEPSREAQPSDEDLAACKCQDSSGRGYGEARTS